MCVCLHRFMCVCLGVNLKWSLELVSSVFCSIWQQVTCVLGGGGWGGVQIGGPCCAAAVWVSTFSMAAYVCALAACTCRLCAGWERRECSALTPPLVLLSLPTPGGHWWGVMWGGGGSDSSVTLTRALRPLSQSGIAHPQCQRGEFIFLAPALPSADCEGPPTAGVPLSLCPKSLLLLQPEKDLLGTRGMNGEKKCLWPPLNLK